MSGWAAISWPDVALAAGAGLLLCELDLLLTSAVLHRGLAHRALAFPRAVERAVCVWAWLSEFARPLSWIASHRHHHAHADTADDPHSPWRKGPSRVVLLSWYYVTAWTDAHRDLARARYLGEFRDDRVLQLLDRPAVAALNFYGQLALSLLHPVALALLAGRLLPYMLAIGYMNAAGHMVGSRRHDNLGTDARGFWPTLAAWLLAGEPLGHNLHHRFPRGASFRPAGIDPGHWFATRILRGEPAEPGGAAGSRAAPPAPVGITSG